MRGDGFRVGGLAIVSTRITWVLSDMPKKSRAMLEWVVRKIGRFFFDCVVLKILE